MPIRRDYPDTHGEWVSPNGFPLVEIRSDGDGQAQYRPRGGVELSQLSEGAKAAARIQHDEYFLLTPPAATRAQLMLFAPAPRPPGVFTPEQIANFERVEADRAREVEICERALLLGEFAVRPAVEDAPKPA
jgi:hypothetical protein